jgi:tetratricopeptide (TPR) repeat protein
VVSLDLRGPAIVEVARARRSWIRITANWVASDHKLPGLVRLSAAYGFFWALLQISTSFGIKVLPDNWRGLAVYALISLSSFLSVELLILNLTRPKPSTEGSSKSPEEVFAEGLISYARSLAEEGQYKDQAILELRSWSSRLLHLMGAVKERTELGQIALTAAAVLQDKPTQASILIDDLGWSLYKAGDRGAAEANIEEAVRILGEELSRDPQNSICLSLKAKAVRHVANIRADGLPLPDARKQFVEARALLSALVGLDRELNVAQIKHSEAEVILHHLEQELRSPSAQVDPSGNLAKLLNEAVQLAEDAELSFKSLGDIEREAKALKVKTQLLAHDPRKQKYREAATRLSRLQREVARNLR